MKLVNLTPHSVTLIGNERTLTVPPSGTVARCATDRRVVDTIVVDGVVIPVTATTMGDIEGLPPAEPGTLLIVSRVVAEAARERTDLVIPDDTVRDEQGRIIGCRALARL